MAESGQKSPEQALEELELHVRKSIKKIHLYKTLDKILILVMLTIFISFIFLFKSAVQANFTQEKLQASIKSDVEYLRPDLVDALKGVYTKIEPVYKDKLHVVTNQVMNKATEVFEKRTENWKDRATLAVETHMNDAINGALDEQMPLLKDCIPGIDDPKKRQEITQDLLSRIQDESEDLIEHAVYTYLHDVEGLKADLMEFAESRKGMDETQLEADLIHYMLMLVDLHIQEIVNSGEKADLGGHEAVVRTGKEGGE